MGTHPIFESDFDCLTDKMSVYIPVGGLVRTLFPSNVFVRLNGRVLSGRDWVADGVFVTVSPRALGGKGGYGQLLKDFGKETALSRNKKSCRDLSGRIVRDLDDIEDLKKWVKNNPTRKKEKAEERVSRLERALVEPKHMMDSSRHSEQKEIISENQNGAFAAFRKRKIEEEEAGKLKPKRKIKWYEKEEEEIPEAPKIEIKSPATLRNEIHELKIKEKTKKSVSKSTATGKQPNSKFSIKNGSVITAAHQIELAREKPIWDADFIESEDPDELKRLAIAKREAEFAAAKSVPPTAEINYDDIDLNAVERFEELEKLELNHLKYLLQVRKLKCGGNATERARRLFSVRGLEPSQYPKKIRAKQ